jgi:cytochrome c oxidase assembly protein subunit 15
VALAILICVGMAAFCSRRCQSAERAVAVRLSLFWLGLILVQVGLGAATIWTNKAADVATAHVLVGALALAVGALWCAIAFRESVAAVYDRRKEDQHSPNPAAIGAQPAMTGNK